MNNSSAQELYSITLDGEIMTNDTITISVDSSFVNYDSMIGSAISNGDYITITSDNSYSEQYEIDFGDNWRTHFPDFYEVESMCKEYPALEKAFENFKTIYEMVKDDYASKIKNSNT